ncbi:MAG: DUF2905 domain-containing protein [Gammaproteobacteria bacterium]|nr:DUF2905 domain-containing protein [Gammaproteobacteria bacterium]MBU1645566.1 DUF2905 domain-containing protein [Gammaproteobacteria bacterium]MBU1973632.1 DUF2905 domain-containing protein [Gammaproteobacteria bacterium]
MLKWIFTLCLVVLVIGVLQPRLAAWLKLGRLPGDLHFRLRGREYLLPFASVILLSLLASVLMRLL